jgi:hypothetical protein
VGAAILGLLLVPLLAKAIRAENRHIASNGLEPA